MMMMEEYISVSVRGFQNRRLTDFGSADNMPK
jgi:hypothetical protein